MRFGQTGAMNSPDGLASLALLRALTKRLVEKGVIDLKTVETIKAEALHELGTYNNDGLKDARRLVQIEFP